MEGFNSVDDLKPFKTMWRVKVSIVRLWKQYSAAGGLTIEIVFIDSNGDKIHVSVKKELVNQFEHKLEQGKILTFTNFSLNHSVGSYRMTNHLYKISVLATTRVRSCEALPVGLNGFTPVNFQEVLDGSLNPDFLIGEYSSIISYVVNIRKLKLGSRDVRLPMVLWGNFATDVTNAIQLRGEDRVILVLRFGKIKVWKVTAQNYFKSTPLIFAFNFSKLEPCSRIVVSRFSVLGSYECEEYLIIADPQIIEFLCTAKVNEIHADKGSVWNSVSDQTGSAVLVAFDELATITNIHASEAAYIMGVGVNVQGGADVPQAKLLGVDTQGSAVAPSDDCSISAVSTKQQPDPEENGPKKACLE
ncbi:hypothetical protein F2Q68_00024769 [Brassica cretica]|uniref:Replication protein A 70 kDa DNA-binding subunit B/D first OB fold domain-containing protein n=1 Tax=Brassica cretica TaxID=69181 RepID=A0A8S9ID97_BRACR|nr:hypothetical protein F2Q68_00024769 [Brassica cretica]